MKSEENPFRGRWSIVKTAMWDADALNMLVPAHISFGDNLLGEMELVAIGAAIDYRVIDRDGQRQVEFSWSGYDASEPACGRGWGRISGDVLSGHCYPARARSGTSVRCQSRSRAAAAPAAAGAGLQAPRE